MRMLKCIVGSILVPSYPTSLPHPSYLLWWFYLRIPRGDEVKEEQNMKYKLCKEQTVYLNSALQVTILLYLWEPLTVTKKITSAWKSSWLTWENMKEETKKVPNWQQKIQSILHISISTLHAKLSMISTVSTRTKMMEKKLLATGTYTCSPIRTNNIFWYKSSWRYWMRS